MIDELQRPICALKKTMNLLIINKLAAHTDELFLWTSVCFYFVNASFELDELEHKLPHVCMAFITKQYIKQITDLTTCKGIFFFNTNCILPDDEFLTKRYGCLT
jgi:hypothetical protein